MMFFYFLKIIFDISTSKRSKKYKPYLILAKNKKIQIWTKRRYKRSLYQVEGDGVSLKSFWNANLILIDSALKGKKHERERERERESHLTSPRGLKTWPVPKYTEFNA
jgi:hypothetical protein